MKPFNLKPLVFSLLLVATAYLPTFGQCVDCPECGSKVAVGFLEKSSKSRNVYEVTQKEIAVPNICMPKPLFRLRCQLGSLFTPKCTPDMPCGPCEIGECEKRIRQGRVRVINVMKKSSVKCDKCSYSWEVTDLEKVDEYLYGPFDEEEGKTEGGETDEVIPVLEGEPMESVPQLDQELPAFDETVPPVQQTPLLPEDGASGASTQIRSNGYLIHSPTQPRNVGYKK